MYERSVRSVDHVRHYAIRSAGASGWEVTLEEDQKLQRKDVYRDWHRVERALALIEQEVSDLTADGWWMVPGDLVSR